jgi:hypothetical protein
MVKKGRSVWPAWLPMPRTWWRTLVLSAVGMGTGLVLLLMEMWRYLILALVTQEPIFLLLGVLILGGAVLWYLGFLGVYALALRIFWQHPPQWLRVGKLGDRSMDFYIMAIATLPVALRLWPYFLETDITLIEILEANQGSLDAAAGLLLLTWVPIVALSLHIADRRRKQKPPSVPN